MDEVPRIGDLQIDQDLAHQKRAWAVRRAGRAAMVLLVLAALAGLAGPGPLSEARAGDSGDPLALEYNRFTRRDAPAELRLRLNRPQGSEARVWLGSDYLEGAEIESVQPEPDRVEAGTDRTVFVFPLVEPGNATAVTFYLKPRQVGSLAGRVGLEGGPSLRFDQFVYP